MSQKRSDVFFLFAVMFVVLLLLRTLLLRLLLLLLLAVLVLVASGSESGREVQQPFRLQKPGWRKLALRKWGHGASDAERLVLPEQVLTR